MIYGDFRVIGISNRKFQGTE